MQVPEVKALVRAGTIGRSTLWPEGWIFDSQPFGVTIEKYSAKAMIVVADGSGWMSPNEHNTARFPQIFVDIWASPRRKDDGSAADYSADTRIEEIFDAIRPYLHTVNMSVPGNPTTAPTLPYLGRPGSPRFWGTPEQIQARTGALVISSQQLGEPDFSDVRDGNGARMGRYRFGIQTA